MKKNLSKFLILVSLIFIYSCDDATKKVESKEKKLSTDLVKNNQTSSDKKLSLTQPIVEILESEFDFGEIKQGDKVSHNYKIKNIGNADLLISSAKGSCGCTVPTWRKADGSATWQPGEDGTIGVKYATNRVGKFTKTITLSTNADKRPVILTIKGEVKAPPKDEGAMPVKKNTGSPLERN